MTKAGLPPGLGALFLSVFIGLMGFGVLLPVFPFWGRALGTDPAYITLAMGAYSLGQFLGAPLWGKLSDSHGRRPVLLWSLGGGAISYAVMAYADSILMLGLARLFGGLMAGNIAVAFAYVGDVVGEEGRPRAMGLLGAAFGLGFIFGPAIGGLVAGDAPGPAEFARVAWVSVAITLVAVIAVWRHLPESLTPERRAATKASGGGPRAGELLRQKPAVLALILLVLIVIGSAAMMETTFALFADDRLNWSARDVGLAFAFIGIVSAVIQGAGAAPLARRFGATRVALGGICAYAIGMLALAMAASSVSVLVALAMTATGVGMFNPAYQTMVAATTSDADRGMVNGLTQGGSAVGRIIGPAVSGLIFQSLGPAMPFLIGSVMMIFAFALAISAGRQVKAGQE
jgi:DHA1 family tetracycline resistance protein-like MFS transporter